MLHRLRRAVARPIRRVLGAVGLDLRSTNTVPTLTHERDAARQALAHTTAQLTRSRADAAAMREARDAAQARSQRRARDLRRNGYAYRGLMAAISGTEPSALGPVTLAPIDRATDRQNRREAARVQARSTVADDLASGTSLDDAVIGMARRMVAKGDHATARSVGQALEHDPATRDLGCAIGAIVAHNRGFDGMAHELFGEISAAQRREWCLAEYAHSSARSDPAALATLITDLDPDDVAPEDAMAVLQAAVGAELAEPAADWAARLQAVAGTPPWEPHRAELDRLAGWIETMVHPPAPAQVEPGAIAYGVIDYRQPDHAQSSSNIGDYVQTIAATGHLVRHQGLRLQGPEDLVEVVGDLADRVRPEHAVPGGDRAVHLVPVNRDASHLDPIPQDTWLIAFGWYMHATFGLRTDFPFHPNLRPIFISFHCNRLEMLTDEALEYLRRHAPIGCRDHNTVDLLLAAGVPAFFSGCLTTTTGTVFPAAGGAPDDAPTVYVDTDGPKGAPTLSQESAEVRERTLAANMRAAVDLLDSYRTEYSQVVTSRLHCYLPCWSIGIDAEFRAKNAADVRFHGLIDADDEDRAAMRDRITELLGVVHTAILAGEDAEAVYAAWRQACEPEVQRARARHAQVPAVDPLSFDLHAEVDDVLKAAVHVPARTPRDGEPVHVALALDRNLIEQVRVVAAGIADNTDRPVHLHILCREHTPADMAAFCDLFGELDVTWLPCDEIDYGPIDGMLRHITVSTMDRLLLPYLLPDLPTVIYHDIDALTVSDIGVLADLDIGDAPLAARSAIARQVRSGYRNLRMATRRLSDRPERAVDLMRRMFARVPFDYEAFNAGVMVLNLERMRRDDFGSQFLPYVQMYGLNDQEVLNSYAAHERHVLDPAWNAMPIQERLTDPRIIHWAGAQKPWARGYVERKDTWQQYAHRVAARQERSTSGVTA